MGNKRVPRGAGNVLYLDLGDGYICVQIRKNLLSDVCFTDVSYSSIKRKNIS